MAQYKVTTAAGSYLVTTEDAPVADGLLAGAPGAADGGKAAVLGRTNAQMDKFNAGNPYQTDAAGNTIPNPAFHDIDLSKTASDFAAPGLDNKLMAAHNVVSGVTDSMLHNPVALAAGGGEVKGLTGAASYALATLKHAATLGTGIAAQSAVTPAASALGAGPGASALLGDGAGILAGGAVDRFGPGVARAAVDKLPTPGFQTNLDPAEARAVQYGRDNGVQLPTSVITGSKVAQNAENIAQNLPLMAGVAKTARAAEQSTLASAGAGEVAKLAPGSPDAPQPIDAGEALQSHLLNVEKGHSIDANNSYGLFRSIEDQPQFKKNVQTGTKQVDAGLDEAGNPVYKTVPKMEDVQLPVDYRGIKAAVKPLLEETRRGMSITQRESSTGIAAMQAILDAPDVVSASTADQDLGAMKGILRDSGQARSVGQVKFAADLLSKQVDAAAMRAGTDAVAALKAGRESTVSKYQTQDLQDSLGFKNVGTGSVDAGSGVDLVNKLTAPKDKNLRLLQQVAAAAPDHIPAIAQTVVKGLLDKAQAEAGMAKPQTSLSALNNLGPQTKATLFGDRAQPIQDFFTLAKKMGENPNPSGSGSLLAMIKGVGLVLTQPHIGVPLVIGAKPLARMLFNPEAGRNLIAGLNTSAASPAAGLLAKSILKAAPEAVPAPAAAAPAGAPAPAAAPLTPRASSADPALGAVSVTGVATPAVSPETTVKVAGSGAAGHKATYKFVERASLNASHNGVTFEANPKFPLENQRDYKTAINQAKIVKGASRAEFDPRQMTSNGQDATQGPPVADSAGTVYAGNGRKMMLDRVYSGNPDGAAKYKAQMAADAPGLGVDPKGLDGMKEPVLVRELHDSELATPQAKSNAIADFNVSPTAAITPAEQAISDSKRVSSSTLEDIAGRLDKEGPSATLGKVLEGKAGGQVLQKLVDDGVLSEQARAPFLNDQGELTPAGKERVAQLMLGRFFRDPAQLDAMAPETRNRIERIAAPLAQVESVKGWSLTDDTRAALELIEKARQAKKSTIDDFVRQDGLFSKDKWTPQAVTLAKAIKDFKSADLTAAARQYAGDAGFVDAPSMFEAAPTQKASFDAAFGEKSLESVAPAGKPAANALATPKAAKPKAAPAAAPAEAPAANALAKSKRKK